MANRHLSRSIAVQSLFEWDCREGEGAPIEEILRRNVEEFAPGIEDSVFIENLVKGVIKHRVELDDIISKAAPDWPIAMIAPVDRNVLRLGLCELLFSDRKEVPAKVAINEAIEVAKTFGGEASGKFINGVLGTIYKEMGEPGKDEVSARKRRPPEVSFEDMPVEKLAGAVIFNRGTRGVELALVHDIFGYWTMSKGHIEANEDARAGVAREIKEELSLDLKIIKELGNNEYVALDPEKGKIRKQVTYFLAETENPSRLHLNKEQGLDDARWFSAAEIGELKIYDDILPIITKGIRMIAAT
ncbi:MAG: transcription antitermination factor NusB [Patescibacteria group bacterium]